MDASVQLDDQNVDNEEIVPFVGDEGAALVDVIRQSAAYSGAPPDFLNSWLEQGPSFKQP